MSKMKVPKTIGFSALFGTPEGIRIPDLPLRRTELTLFRLMHYPSFMLAA